MLDFAQLSTRFREMVRDDGLNNALKNIYWVARRKVRSRPIDQFDVLHGTETSREVSLWQLTIPHPDAKLGSHYEATSPELFLKACSFLPPAAVDFSFIDIGCGKGRVLILAKEYGFKKVIGIELSGELLEVTRRNLDKSGVGGVDLEHGSALDYRFPEGPLVVFMFNPFGPPALTQVVENLARHPDFVYLIYINPQHKASLDVRFLALHETVDFGVYQSSQTAMEMA